MKRERITKATQFDGKNLQDIFDIPCVVSIHKWPELHATIFDEEMTRHLRAYVGDWICQIERGDIAYWTVLVNEVYQMKQRH
jgi:hypothetical protein